MMAGGKAAAAWRVLLLLSMLWTFAIAKDKPDIKVVTLDNPPLNLNYFEDSDVIVFHDVKEGKIYRSTDAGASWKPVTAIADGKAALLYMHSFEPKTAFVLTAGLTHYKTEDRGETWSKFKTESKPSKYQPEILIFHADDPKRIIFNGMTCESIFCEEQASYTIDGFKNTKLLRSYTTGCWWAKSSKEFTTGDDEKDIQRTLCVVRDPFSIHKQDQRLLVSDSFFEVVGDDIQEFEPNLDSGKEVAGVLSLAVVKKHLLVATTSFNSEEMALYVTDNTLKWHRAMFPSADSHDHSHQINQEAYTVLESTNYSIQVDVMTSKPSHPMGVMFTSNSNGTYFTENVPYTNRNSKGHVDFEKISGIQGVFLVNIVENGEEVEKSGEDKKVITKITFDDGRTFETIKADDDTVHLHSVTEIDNVGRVFSSPAPGLVMGNGNTGKHLKKFEDANLYVSDDAGLTWKKALDGPHKYEFGDSGSILVAIKDSRKENVDKFFYSLDHGKKWESVSLPKDIEIKPGLLTTTQDSTSLKFLLVGEKKGAYLTIAINFEGLHERTCGEDDMEDWHARVDDDNKPTCIMGHKQTFRRRKKSADCFINNEFKDIVPKVEDCECSDADFECDYNFQRDSDDHEVCKNIGPIVVPDGACKDNPDGTFKGSSGWRLIPGNTCERKKGKQKDDKVERKCSSDGAPSPTPPASGEVTHKQHKFDTDLRDFQKVYLGRSGSSTADDETVIARPAEDAGNGQLKVDKKLMLSSDHGKNWKQILEDEEVAGIYPHLHFKDVVFFTTKDTKVIYTIDLGESFHNFKPPTKAIGGFPLSFHPDKKDWLIWVGQKCDDVGGKESCYKEASISTDRGDNWRTILRYVQRCEFTGNSAFNFRSTKQITCLARTEEKEDSPLTVKVSNDFFVDDKYAFKGGDVTEFATMDEFIVLAGEDEETENMRAMISLDGKNYEQARFPYNFHEGHDNQFTVLDSSTHAVNLFVRTEAGVDRQYGSIIKSNSNGTSYVLSAANVNCNADTFVDFEKVSGLEGVTLINVVTNTGKDEKKKKLQTKISHNDGSEWSYLAPPAKDASGKSFKCSSAKGDASCALHLHHYTERDDKRKTFAADTAIGMLFGIGNVGSTLGDIKEADTFMTADGGVTWTTVKKGHWTWQYGDQGSIIVLVQRATHDNPAKTKSISYSIDEGKTWKDYEFAESEVTVLDITTVRSGTSRNFLLWCKSGDGKLLTVNLDFTGLADKPCKYEKEGESDYYLWSPKHPLQDDDCLFGHVAKYMRKKPGRKCYNEKDLQRLYEYSDCQCSRRDYECAYNYEMDNHGQCKLVQGMEPLSGKDWCEKNPNETSWFEPTGYRKLYLSTCKGGNEMDKTSTEHPCAGYEDEFERRHRTSGLAIFFAVVIPFAIAGAIGWYVYRNWDGKFGQIRLGDHSSSTFDSDQPWIKYPVIAVSAAAAVIAALPLLAASLWRTVTGSYDRVGGGGQSWFSSGTRRFTTRDSFARGRGDYSAVDDDEGELLGDDSDEEV